MNYGYNHTQLAFVNGIEGARSYQLLPNQTMFLMDNENPVFYMKTSNQLGQSNIRGYKFEEINLNSNPQTDELNELRKQIQELKQIIGGNNESNIKSLTKSADTKSDTSV